MSRPWPGLLPSRVRAWLAGQWRRLPRTVRLRLTLVYVGLFVVSAVGLLTIVYLTLQTNGPARLQSAGGGGSLSAGTTAGRLCFSSGNPPLGPTNIRNCTAFIKGAQHASDLSRVLLGSGVALAAMTVLAVGIGWLIAGRVLRPLRTITVATQHISASNLHQRLDLAGPDDELKELGDTVDGLLSRLEWSFAAQRQFVANASHELRTPLARQRTLVEVALADPEPTLAGLRAVCTRVLAAGEQQERLIEALLTLARSQRGLDQWDLIDVAAITADVVVARLPDARRLGISLAVSGGGQEPVPAMGDARLTERLVANLVDNALRHNGPGGWVSVQTGTILSQAVLRVANSGPVIPPAEVARLFEPFERLGGRRVGDPTAAGVEEGERRESPGLGLSIVSAIAAAHGAQLNASASDSGGLAIEVRFPPLPASGFVRAGDPGARGHSDRVPGVDGDDEGEHSGDLVGR